MTVLKPSKRIGMERSMPQPTKVALVKQGVEEHTHCIMSNHISSMS